jgi:hypothetical protein
MIQSIVFPCSCAVMLVRVSSILYTRRPPNTSPYALLQLIFPSLELPRHTECFLDCSEHGFIHTSKPALSSHSNGLDPNTLINPSRPQSLFPCTLHSLRPIFVRHTAGFETSGFFLHPFLLDFQTFGDHRRSLACYFPVAELARTTELVHPSQQIGISSVVGLSV